jgi:UDP-N-acetylglucosamine--N-acetylmuramyl-(pentapeptide) pyrophosphoryl-undecaprenol N-acetylglucosamine transferase
VVDAPKSLRIVCYAVNGAGVGHLVRLIGIARWLRRYALHAGVRPEIWFLTSSEAETMLFAEQFAAFKMPSKTVVADAGIDKLAWIALAKQWVWHSLGLLRPDLLIVDTFPRGSFGELLSALDLCRKKAFIYRPVKDAIADRPDFQSMLPLYDAVLVPERAADAPMRMPDGARASWFGPTLVREPSELLSRRDARDRLGVVDERPIVYVSAGGGGDDHAGAHLEQVQSALHGQGYHLVVAAGPLFRGVQRHGPGITWLSGGPAVELMAGIDVAVSAAGYNSWNELMMAGVPTVFLPQPKIADEQDRRADRAVQAGAARMVAGLEPAAIRGAVVELLAAGEHARAAARGLVPRNHARELAAALLRLSLPHELVDRAVAAVDDQALVTARSVGFDTLVELAGALDVARTEPSADVMTLARQVLAAADRLRVPIPVATRLAGALAKKLPGASSSARAAAIIDFYEGVAPFEDWGLAQAMVKLFGLERQGDGAAWRRGLRALLARLPVGHGSLTRAVELLSAAQGISAVLPTNEALVARALERLG